MYGSSQVFSTVSAGTRLGHLPAMSEINELVEALPETEPKGTLRGMATAARIADEPSRAEILGRMAALTNRLRQADPLTKLGVELERQLGEKG
jgi:hypothetical protein